MVSFFELLEWPPRPPRPPRPCEKIHNLSCDPDRGCPAATLRVWPWNVRNKTPVELCGDSVTTTDQYKEIKSETNLMRVS